MKTEIVSATDGYIQEEDLLKAGSIIKAGGLVAFPTETVYGLGGDALNPDSSKKIYAAKGRPSDNPLIVHISSLDDLEIVAKDIPDVTYEIADMFWPGPLTMIFNKQDVVPKETTGGLDTVAVRFPSHPIAQKFIDNAGGFIAAPSANRSGRPSPTVAKYVIEDLDGLVEMIIDGGSSQIGLESTIIDMTVNPPMILRPGYVTEEDLKRILEKVDIDKTILSDSSGQAPKAPGMKYRHYAPKADMTIVYGNSKEVAEYINSEAEKAYKSGKNVGIMGTDESISLYRCDIIKSLGSREDGKAIARNLFRVLREFDDEDVQVIFSEGFNDAGLFGATMNRLKKAAGHKEVYL